MPTVITLLEEHITLLRTLPEQGMGYHIVDIVLHDNTHLTGRIVSNCSNLHLLEGESINPEDIKTIEPITNW